jgi:hypothetical protein
MQTSGTATITKDVQQVTAYLLLTGVIQIISQLIFDTYCYNSNTHF